ncbi:unnamed protein product [Schistocephalus solidus]|uniref:Uncharacterized protein n=1 Tax=Schistocephalus solidus TaxID=70667 RepID=A0A183TAR5_SCHSO|nr:unnamed protein product [Schistocephalus solidus]
MPEASHDEHVPRGEPMGILYEPSPPTRRRLRPTPVDGHINVYLLIHLILYSRIRWSYNEGSGNEGTAAWLGKGETRSISTSILAHLVDTNHRVDPKEAFQVVYQTAAYFSKGLRQRVLATAETVGVRITNPALCCQKTLVQALSLQ